MAEKKLSYYFNNDSKIPFLMNILKKLFNEKIECLKYFNEFNKDIKEVNIKKIDFKL